MVKLTFWAMFLCCHAETYLFEHAQSSHAKKKNPRPFPAMLKLTLLTTPPFLAILKLTFVTMPSSSYAVIDFLTTPLTSLVKTYIFDHALANNA